jgi:hypothetical protein
VLISDIHACQWLWLLRYCCLPLDSLPNTDVGETFCARLRMSYPVMWMAEWIGPIGRSGLLKFSMFCRPKNFTNGATIMRPEPVIGSPRAGDSLSWSQPQLTLTLVKLEPMSRYQPSMTSQASFPEGFQPPTLINYFFYQRPLS